MLDMVFNCFLKNLLLYAAECSSRISWPQRLNGFKTEDQYYQSYTVSLQNSLFRLCIGVRKPEVYELYCLGADFVGATVCHSLFSVGTLSQINKSEICYEKHLFTASIIDAIFSHPET